MRKGASKVISIDGQTPRLELARKCGATDVIDMNDFTTSEARVRRVKEGTDGRGADIVLEVVGIAAATVEGPEKPAGCSKRSRGEAAPAGRTRDVHSVILPRLSQVDTADRTKVR